MQIKLMVLIIVAAAIAIPSAIFTISPLFVDTVIEEESPLTATANASAIEEFQRFMELGEEQRLKQGQAMQKDKADMIMMGAAQIPGQNVNEEMSDVPQEPSIIFAGNFIGVNDGIHNAEGIAKVIDIQGGQILRLENFKSTNGPDLYVYLSADGDAKEFIDLGRLKGNIGNQNYNIPEGTDLSKYDKVLIWCKAFSVLFGSAKLVEFDAS